MAFQATSGSQREKWVGAFIPAAAILLIGFFYINFYAAPELEKVERKFNSTIVGGVGPEVVARLNANAKKLREDQAEMKRMIRSVDDEIAAKSAAFESLNPTAKHSAVTALCRDHDIAILQDQTVKEIRLPPLRRESIETLKSLVSEDAIGFRELTLAANYATVVSLMKKLHKIPGVIPVSVQLKKSKIVDSSRESEQPEVSWTVGLLM